ncbi:restriction endonuclease subunit S [Escherichia coli]|uniref:restriction endonuclease subunit S n=1 Tax=Escherichia coli TaxID=562 RepID=UPI000578EAAD|nr:restriction endonuclease subunit S [Escherichia coli]
MSEMSYLEKLLDGVEVEWLPLGEITKYEQPTKYLVKAKDYHDTYTIPVLTAGKTFILGYTNETHGIYQASKAPVIIFDDFTTANKWVDFDFKAKSSAMKMVTSCDDNKTLLKYVYYWLNTLPSEFAEGDHKRQWISNYSQKKIPIPCPDNPEKSLAIQSEIVRILDKFTALTAELTAELNMRKKQYNYYRDQLLSFKEGEVEWKALGEIGEVRMCKRILKSQTSSEGEIPFYKIGTFGKEPDSYISRKLFNEFKEKYSYPKVGEVLISASGTIGRTVIFDGRESYFQDSNIVWIENNEKIVLNKYLFYFYKIAKWGISEGGTIKRLYNDNLRKLMIPVPFPDSPERSLVEQQKIVKLLDKFDALTNSITEGLPREIELRQKQYEYYRDLLFSFPKPDTVSN